jgi:hypothetical protein
VQARFLGAAAGASCGLSAVLMRAVQVLQVHSVLDPLRLLGVVAALGTGFLGLVLTQAAFARGRVTASLPTQDLAALLVSIGAGAALVGEVPGLGPWTTAGAAAGLLLAARGSRQLAREPGAPASGPLLAHDGSGPHGGWTPVPCRALDVRSATPLRGTREGITTHVPSDRAGAAPLP